MFGSTSECSAELRQKFGIISGFVFEAFCTCHWCLLEVTVLTVSY